MQFCLTNTCLFDQFTLLCKGNLQKKAQSFLTGSEMIFNPCWPFSHFLLPFVRLLHGFEQVNLKKKNQKKNKSNKLNIVKTVKIHPKIKSGEKVESFNCECRHLTIIPT